MAMDGRMSRVHGCTGETDGVCFEEVIITTVAKLNYHHMWDTSYEWLF